MHKVDCNKCPIWRHCWGDVEEEACNPDDVMTDGDCPLVMAIEAISHSHSIR